MVRKKHSTLFVTFCVILILSQVSYAQEFTKSKGMVFFNRAVYDSAIIAINQWIPEHPDEEDIAKYYLAESFYNIAMSESQTTSARQNFRQAHRFFQDALSYSGLKVKYEKLYYSAQIKTGWCFYRRAETGERPSDLLNIAYNSFQSIDPSIPDSLKLPAYFLAGESRYRAGVPSGRTRSVAL